MYDPCTVCGNETHEERIITHIFTTPTGQKIVIDNIPATVCKRCGEATFSFPTAQHISEIVYAVSQKTLTASRVMPVYEFAA